MFAGEAQTHLLMDSYLAIGAGALIATGLVKAALTPLCIQMGWRGGHFFPLIFRRAWARLFLFTGAILYHAGRAPQGAWEPSCASP